ncbi:GGDEF domain-containing protein [Halarcobacter sp.]|uniref:GGDEF domain-containing protein n=1 Tax=Halarcobacter sp. TaxID=2321133 RepID=UPI003A8F4704
MRKNITLYTIVMIIMLSVTISIFSLYNLRKTGIKSAIHNAQSISEVVKSGLTAHMINGNMQDVDTFINSASNIKNVEQLWLVRSKYVNEQFPSSHLKNPPRDDFDKKALATGKMQYKIEEEITSTTVRVTIPYNAVAEKGIDCLKCHQVEQGTTLGAVSIVLDISTIKEIGIESIYVITVLILTTIILFILVSRRLISPYLRLFDKFKININQATHGRFKGIVLPSGLSAEMIHITEDYNNLIQSFKDTAVDIDKKLQGFVGFKASNKNRNPLKDSKEIIDNLSNLYQFKKQIELDNTKEEIYDRLAEVLRNKFNLKNFSFVEIDMKKHKMTTMKQCGESLYCDETLKNNPEVCRAARTKSDVMSVQFHNTCPHFDSDKLYYCFNVDITQSLYLIINCVCDTQEELEELKEKTVFIKSYLKESVPSIEVKLLMNALQESAFTDGLTGLYNRKFLEEYTKKMLPQVKRDGTNIALLMLDMDHFKAVNDEYGHDIGDKVLKELARILNETVRESDIIIRYGGEEFMILLMGVNSDEDALSVARKIGDKVRENEIDVYAGNKLKKTVSLGLSMYPEDSTSFETVIKNADIALYEAKNSGRDKVVRFKEEQVSSVDLF